MTSKMLIDASHPEETRVVVTKGNRVEEFDFESASRRQLRGNIYLAKVTRVEPSLQAAFVDFGGNRHGFLAFSEIHPDYYQIPVADRQALLDEEAQADSEDEDDGEDKRNRRGSNRRRRGRGSERAKKAGSTDESVSENASDAEGDGNGSADLSDNGDDGDDHNDAAHGDNADRTGDSGDGDDHADDNGNGDGPEEVIEQIGGADALEEVPRRAFRPRKQYKIQEVIKRRQILLVQVVKEERGNKGAALTTYLSLAGRYSVLMPNTARGGGISRKITSSADRKRLKTIATDLEVPDGMGVILRTAGASRTKTEVKRDFEYLIRLWESVRELTLQSTAPALVYEEGSLIKRAIRDLYSKEVEEVLVSGDDGYREAKDFMKMLMPSHAKMVKPFKDPQPLFARYAVEQQLDAMFNNVVTLRSGGYIVINQTEALVSIDVNSGRATREHNIEDTALKTNLEAAEEVARQLRLRDLAGLIVIDFIDMEEKRNNRAVERKINDCLKNDRARIQLGRISHFGLLEMSRQRIRTGVLESSTSPCPHCAGTGLRRATASIALNLVRALEEALMKNAAYDLIVRTPTEIALYVLNHKRETLVALEGRFGVQIIVRADDAILPPQYHAFERGELSVRPVVQSASINTTTFAPVEIEDEDDVVEEATDEADEDTTPATTEERAPRGGEPRSDDGTRRRRRRRRRRGGRGPDGEAFNADAQDRNGEAGDDTGTDSQETGEDGEAEAAAPAGDGAQDKLGEDGRPRRRRRRGGRRNRREDGTRETDEGQSDGVESEGAETGDAAVDATVAAEVIAPVAIAEEPPVVVADVEAVGETDAPAKPKRKPRARKIAIKTAEEPVADAVMTAEPTPVAEAPAVEAVEVAPEPVAPPPPAPEPVSAPEPVIEEEPVDPNRPKRSGWWSKAKQALGG